MFVRISAGAIAEGPNGLTGSWVGSDGTTYTNMAIWTESERNALGWFAISATPPAYDPSSQTLTAGAITVVNGVPTQQYTVSGPTTDQVDAIRDARLAAGYADATTGKSYQCTDGSIAKLGPLGSSAAIAVLMNINPAPTFEIIAQDNDTVTLSAADAYALLNGRVMPWVSATYLYANNLKTQIRAGSSPAINTGWP